MDLISSLVVGMKALSSTYKMWSTERVVPFDVVGVL